MEAQVWTLIGVLTATILGAFVYLGNRIDALAARLDARIDSQGADLRRLIDSQGADLKARIDSQGTDLRALIEAQSVDFANRMYELAAKLDDHLRRHAS